MEQPLRRNTKRSRSLAICRATAAELFGCHNIALDLVERLTVGLDAMLIHALCVRGCTALWAPIFHHGSLNPIKTLSAHCGIPIRARRVHLAIGATPLNHLRRHWFLAIGALRQHATFNLAGRVGCCNRCALKARGANPHNHMWRHTDAVKRAHWPYSRVFFKDIMPREVASNMCIEGVPVTFFIRTDAISKDTKSRHILHSPLLGEAVTTPKTNHSKRLAGLEQQQRLRIVDINPTQM